MCNLLSNIRLRYNRVSLIHKMSLQNVLSWEERKAPQFSDVTATSYTSKESFPWSFLGIKNWNSDNVTPYNFFKRFRGRWLDIGERIFTILVFLLKYKCQTVVECPNNKTFANTLALTTRIGLIEKIEPQSLWGAFLQPLQRFSKMDRQGPCLLSTILDNFRSSV